MGANSLRALALRMIILLALVFSLAVPPARAQSPGPKEASFAPDETLATAFTAASAGADFTCALTMEGGVKCWGRNDGGQLGDGTTVQRSAPVQVVGLESGVIALASGGWHVCALTSGGGVLCWGSNGYGQLGDGTTQDRLLPAPVSGLASGVVELKAGIQHTCALLTGGGVKCWGDNIYGQLGDGTTTSSSTPVDVVGLSGAMAGLAAGGHHSCSLSLLGSAQCWGYNASGQLGNGQQNNSATPVSVLGLPGDVTALEAGAYHTCAQTSGGEALCWGDNSWAQLGDGTFQTRLAPTLVLGLSGVTRLAPGYYHSCALIAGGGVKCWGGGVLGNGQDLASATPVNVVGLSNGAVALAIGWSHTCAVIDGGGMQCWGEDYDGQLGIGTVVSRGLPVDVPGLPPAGIAAAGLISTCATTRDGQTFCWGSNDSGQLGDGSTRSSATPVEVMGLADVMALATGMHHNCALTLSGEVKCWGDNFAGQLGNGSTESSSIPVDVVGLNGPATALTAGDYHTCALTSSGGVQCWGLNALGQLGNGTTTSSPVPVDVVGLESGAEAVAAGGGYTCALTTAGEVRCWGDNSLGQLGDGTTIDRLTPVNVSGLTSEGASVSAGFGHTCVQMLDGTARCWGYNHFGQLGDGTTEDRLEPVEVIGLGGEVLALAAAEQHTCAIIDGGKVQCWGDNDSRQLGDGGVAGQLTPTDVAGLTSGVAILTGHGLHTCAVLSSGTMKCWGSDQHGQLGLGTVTRRLTPVEVIEAAPVHLWPNAIFGQPGSVFTLTGQGFPTGALATVSVNGSLLSDALTVLPGGGFVFFLDTAGAEAGVYRVTVSANPSAAVTLALDPDSTLRPLEGGGLTLPLPAGIATQESASFYPLVYR